MRVGSVGLVVTDACIAKRSAASTVTPEQLWYLKPRAFAVVSPPDGAGDSVMGQAMISPQSRSRRSASARSPADEEGEGEVVASDEGTEDEGNDGQQRPAAEDEDEAPLCYCCCDDAEVLFTNPLVSACACRGGTRWLHLACLERLLRGEHGAGHDGREAPCVMFRNQNGAATCKVCRTEYRKQCELPGSSGRVISIPQPSLRPPYICFKVVTHNAHSAYQDSIFNSTFHVSFATLVDNKESARSPAGGASEPDEVGSSEGPLPTGRQPLVIGRSTEVDMQLNYQTVSGRHAALHLTKGKFFISDLKSSNGTFMYVREPMRLRPDQTVRLRMGRRTVKFTAVAPSAAAAAAAALFSGPGRAQRPKEACDDVATGAVSPPSEAAEAAEAASGEQPFAEPGSAAPGSTAPGSAVSGVPAVSAKASAPLHGGWAGPVAVASVSTLAGLMAVECPLQPDDEPGSPRSPPGALPGPGATPEFHSGDAFADDVWRPVRPGTPQRLPATVTESSFAEPSAVPAPADASAEPVPEGATSVPAVAHTVVREDFTRLTTMTSAGTVESGGGGGGGGRAESLEVQKMAEAGLLDQIEADIEGGLSVEAKVELKVELKVEATVEAKLSEDDPGGKAHGGPEAKPTEDHAASAGGGSDGDATTGAGGDDAI